MRARSVSTSAYGVWLHQVHFQSGRAVPSALQGENSLIEERKRKAGLEALLQKAVLGQELAAEAGSRSLMRYPEGEAVSLDESHINFTVDGKATPLIPLLLADVMYEPVRKRYAFSSKESASHVVLVAPRPCANLADNPAACSKVWLLCVGTCKPEELSNLLLQFSRRGALRWDVKQCYSISRKCLGSGGQGAVFTGAARSPASAAGQLMKEDRRLLDMDGIHRLDMVAVKVWNYEANNLNALRSEIRFLQKMCGHPNVSTLLGVFCEAGTEAHQKPQWVTITELCAGGDLFDLVADGVIQQENVMQVMVGIFSALIHLHCNRIVHRDVKAENVVLHGERAVLVDFGIACKLDDLESMKKRVGSPGYVAPEIIQGKRYNEKVDIFAAGIIIYFMLRGKLPFSAETHDAMLEKTAKCEVSYDSEAFRDICPELKQMMKMTISRDVNRPSAWLCFEALFAMASREVRTSEAFQISRSALVHLGIIRESLLQASQDAENLTEDASATEDSDPASISSLAMVEETCSLRDTQGRRPARTDNSMRTRSSSGSVWQLIQEIPAAAVRGFRKISSSGSFTAVRQMCNVAGDLPKVALSFVTPTHSEDVSVASFADVTDRADTLLQLPEHDSLTLSIPSVAVPTPPAAARQMPVPKHRQRYSRLVPPEVVP
mmetsp:Transcript_72379/g.172888  ORF Transcript_72379/g.172888 Transcript_72379/m.172888 type:complete len:663 (-) Transcript_72379:121-2109(-)|eukprot:CAMPEP_0181436056 /NCGR_PEP_ID=MMETSP1110-20121109/20651_1 /TAXON_ID=174948 /ORGANISM="Symbiodinium sp., Strain CCMP421" /LENGTH=662 /DNA_ID=CAMNT_0023559609 /DNA_START=31 /DNA_END=2019 /DNA_ORIENTATION=+